MPKYWTYRCYDLSFMSRQLAVINIHFCCFYLPHSFRCNAFILKEKTDHMYDLAIGTKADHIHSLFVGGLKTPLNIMSAYG